MLEIPEALVVSRQIAETYNGKRIERVAANTSPHGFAWFWGDPDEYPSLLCGERIGGARAVGGQVEINAGRATLLFGDGVNLRHFSVGKKLPEKHQMLVTFEDGTSLCANVQMYGGLWAFPNGANDNPYYLVARDKPSPLSDAFDEQHFNSIVSSAKASLSAKALLATEQRIPGLGNGVLQDILFLSGVHPAYKVSQLSDSKLRTLFGNIKSVLVKMSAEGGRDTERDLHGLEGGYRTLLSRKTLAYPCPKCGGGITRKAYLGGNVYYCETCQPLHTAKTASR